jgi:hypothetical protein
VEAVRKAFARMPRLNVPGLSTEAQACAEEALRKFAHTTEHSFSTAASPYPHVALQVLREAGLQADAERVALALVAQFRPSRPVSMAELEALFPMPAQPSAPWQMRLIEALVVLKWKWRSPPR